MSLSEITAASEVPPPMSTIMLPLGLEIGHVGADGGRQRLGDQVRFFGARLDRRVQHRALSTLVTPAGMHTMTTGRNSEYFPTTLPMK